MIEGSFEKSVYDKLCELGEAVYYGAGVFADRNKWDCVVFGRRSYEHDRTARTAKHDYFVAIVKEEYVPQALISAVETALRAIGLKSKTNTATFEYIWKSNEVLIEICVLEFRRTEKNCE